MSSKSKAQQKFMGMVHAKKKGELKDASPEVKKAAKNMKKKDAKDFASTKHKGLPEKVKESFVSESLESFMDKNTLDEGLDPLRYVLLDDLQELGLNWEEADFAMGEIPDEDLEVYMERIENEETNVQEVAQEIKEIAFN